MDAFVVRANGPLSGTVRVCGATKNAGLKQSGVEMMVESGCATRRST